MEQVISKKTTDHKCQNSEQEYKDVPHLGAIPLQWETGRLRDTISEIVAGRSVGGEDRKMKEGEVGVLRVSSVTSGVFKPEKYKVVSSANRDRVKTRPAKNTIILNRANGSLDLVGISALVKEDYPRLFLSDKLWKLKPSHSKVASVRWLHALLQSEIVRKRVIQFARGRSTGMKNVTQRDFRSIPVPIPPLNEQKRIASTLRTWDRHLAHLDALIEQKRTRLKGLRQRLLTGDVRFPAFDAPWQEVRLGSLFERRKDKSRNDLDLLAVTMDRGVIPRDKLDRRDTSNSDKSRYLLAKAGDVVYNSMRMWQGVCGVAPLDGIVSPAYTVCVPQEGIVVDFADELFHLPSVIDLFRRYSQGMVSDTLKLHFRNFAMIRVEIPPTLAEQRRIATVLQEAEREIDQLRALRAARARQKKGLMQRLLTGEVRV